MGLGCVWDRFGMGLVWVWDERFGIHCGGVLGTVGPFEST